MTSSFESLSTEQLEDLLDSRQRTVGRLSYDPKRYRYYEDIYEFDIALRKLGYGPDAIDHELSHGRCALMVGVKAVKYGFEYDEMGLKYNVAKRAVTSLIGPSVIPNIAYAAIQAAPKDPSTSDLRAMQEVGYRSVEVLEERISRWNQADNGLTIPLPGQLDTAR